MLDNISTKAFRMSDVQPITVGDGSKSSLRKNSTKVSKYKPTKPRHNFSEDRDTFPQ